MALIDLADLKSVLGVGSVYPDAELQSCADAAEETILALLTFKQANIVAAKYVDSVSECTYWTSSERSFQVGESVTLTTYIGAPFEGTQTVKRVFSYGFVTDKNHTADHATVTLMPFGKAVLASQSALYDTTESVRQAALAVAVDIFQTRLGTAGQTGLDFQPAPYRMGKSMYSRVSGLLGKYMDSGAFIA